MLSFRLSNMRCVGALGPLLPLPSAHRGAYLHTFNGMCEEEMGEEKERENEGEGVGVGVVE